jgi:hypothetical protein
MPCAEVKRPHMGRLPQNRREDKGNRLDIEMRTNPANLDIFSTDPPMHQLGTGTNRVGRMPTNDCTVAP